MPHRSGLDKSYQPFAKMRSQPYFVWVGGWVGVLCVPTTKGVCAVSQFDAQLLLVFAFCHYYNRSDAPSLVLWTMLGFCLCFFFLVFGEPFGLYLLLV